jgi:hypothetical protein
MFVLDFWQKKKKCFFLWRAVREQVPEFRQIAARFVGREVSREERVWLEFF